MTSDTKVLFASVLFWLEEESHRLCVALVPTSPRDIPFATILRRTFEHHTSDLSDFHLCVTAIKLLNYRFSVLMKTPSVLPEQIRCNKSESVIAVVIEQNRN